MGRNKKLRHNQTIVIDVDSPSPSPEDVEGPLSERNCRRKRPRKKQADEAASASSNKLDSSAFDIHFKDLWMCLPEEKTMLFTYFDCLWFSLYMNPSYKNRVLAWINEKHIFSKKYVLVPVVCWGHWNLLIFCNFGASLESENEGPCMLLLDSLHMADPLRLEQTIRKLVLDIFRSEGRKESEESISEIPLSVPKVPQQREKDECGNYVLYFIKLFVSEAPTNFIMDEYPYFMKEDWFNLEEFAQFCDELKRKPAEKLEPS